MYRVFCGSRSKVVIIMFKKISIVFVFCFGIIIGFLICYMYYKDKIIPKQSTIDKSISQLYPENELLAEHLNETENIKLSELRKVFKIEYMQENEKKDKCYIVLKSSEGGYFFMFFNKFKDDLGYEDYYSYTAAYFKDYVPLASDYTNNIVPINYLNFQGDDPSTYEDVVNMYWYLTRDSYGLNLNQVRLLTRDFVYVEILFGFDDGKLGVECIQTDCTYVDYVLPEDKEFILNKFSVANGDKPKHEKSYMREYYESRRILK